MCRGFPPHFELRGPERLRPGTSEPTSQSCPEAPREANKAWAPSSELGVDSSTPGDRGPSPPHPGVHPGSGSGPGPTANHQPSAPSAAGHPGPRDPSAPRDQRLKCRELSMRRPKACRSPLWPPAGPREQPPRSQKAQAGDRCLPGASGCSGRRLAAVAQTRGPCRTLPPARTATRPLGHSCPVLPSGLYATSFPVPSVPAGRTHFFL